MKKKLFFIIPIVVVLIAVILFVALRLEPAPDPTEPSTTPTIPTTPTTKPTEPTGPVIPKVGELTEEFVRNYPVAPASDFTYEKVDDVHLITGEKYSYIVITGYIGSDCIVVIPDEIDGLPVVSINAATIFGYNSGVRGVKFPTHMKMLYTSMENNLDLEVVIAENVEGRDRATFCGCYCLHTVILSENITSLKAAEFFGCHDLKYLYISENVTSIQADTFTGCVNLTIRGKAGSFVESYCAAHGIPFEAVD